MSFLICNGSPRGKESNSQVISNWIYEEGDKTVLIKLIKKFPEYLNDLKNYEKIVFIYPLYVDGMPGIVKEFLEFIEDNKSIIKNKDLLFIVHCGFSEAVHLRIVERYHSILADIYELKSINTILTPGSEAIRIISKKMNNKRMTGLVHLAGCFRRGEKLSKTILKTLAGDETISKKKRLLFKILSALGLTNIYWNNQLKRNNAYSKRFDKPYQINR